MAIEPNGTQLVLKQRERLVGLAALAVPASARHTVEIAYCAADAIELAKPSGPKARVLDFDHNELER